MSGKKWSGGSDERSRLSRLLAVRPAASLFAAAALAAALTAGLSAALTTAAAGLTALAAGLSAALTTTAAGLTTLAAGLSAALTTAAAGLTALAAAGLTALPAAALTPGLAAPALTLAWILLFFRHFSPPPVISAAPEVPSMETRWPSDAADYQNTGLLCCPV